VRCTVLAECTTVIGVLPEEVCCAQWQTTLAPRYLTGSTWMN